MMTTIKEIRDNKFKYGDRVKKKGNKGQWRGHVVGFYSASCTDIGYAVESEFEKGSVQIYPESALELIEPEKREYKFFIFAKGDVVCRSQLVDYEIELYISQGNAFYTREEAERERDKRALIVKMRDEFGFEPDWSDGKQKLWGIFYNREENGLSVDWWTGVGIGLFDIHFETREKAQACIDKYGEQIKKVLGV